MTSTPPIPQRWLLGRMPGLASEHVTRHPEGCVFCPAELLGLERDRNGDPLCQTCPHLRGASLAQNGPAPLP